MTAISFRWFIFRVEPLDTRSDMMSATPRWGVTSAAPDILVISTCLPSRSKYFWVKFGKEVATTVPSLMSSTLSKPEPSGAAIERRQCPKSSS